MFIVCVQVKTPGLQFYDYIKRMQQEINDFLKS